MGSHYYISSVFARGQGLLISECSVSFAFFKSDKLAGSGVQPSLLC